MMGILRTLQSVNALDIKCFRKAPMLKAWLLADRLLRSNWIMRPRNPLIALLGSSGKI